MKTLKFKPELAKLILSGEKTSTWRMFDDKDLQKGDVVQFVNKETGETFAKAELASVVEKEIGKLEKLDWEGHETYESEEEMYETYRGYYGDRVNPETIIKIVDFKIVS